MSLLRSLAIHLLADEPLNERRHVILRIEKRDLLPLSFVVEPDHVLPHVPLDVLRGCPAS